MKKYFLGICLVAFFFAGCGDSATTPESMAASEPAAAIELTDEEAEILESVEAAPLEEAEPVTRDNYEDALKQLEEELDTDQ